MGLGNPVIKTRPIFCLSGRSVRTCVCLSKNGRPCDLIKSCRQVHNIVERLKTPLCLYGSSPCYLSDDNLCIRLHVYQSTPYITCKSHFVEDRPRVHGFYIRHLYLSIEIDNNIIVRVLSQHAYATDVSICISRRIIFELERDFPLGETIDVNALPVDVNVEVMPQPFSEDPPAEGVEKSSRDTEQNE